jgi:hypothetical protein
VCDVSRMTRVSSPLSVATSIYRSGCVSRCLDLKPISTVGLQAKDVDQLMETTRNLMVEELRSLNSLPH